MIKNKKQKNLVSVLGVAGSPHPQQTGGSASH